MGATVLCTAGAFWHSGETGIGALRSAGCKVERSPQWGPLPAAELEPLLVGRDAVVAGMDEYNAPVIERAAGAGLKVISRWGVGYDSVDVAAAARHGVVVTYTPGATTDAVADLTFALMLSVARSVPALDRDTRLGQWRPARGVYVWRKCLGLIGFGSIGQAVARRARGFEMRVLACDVVPRDDVAAGLGVEMVDLDTLLGEADFVSLHASVTGNSRGMIGERALRTMKSTAYLINTSRGALVDDAALCRALNEGWIAGAGLDAHTAEPLPPDHPILKAPNTVLTPHTAFNTVESCEAVSAVVAQNTLAVLEGREPPFRVTL